MPECNSCICMWLMCPGLSNKKKTTKNRPVMVVLGGKKPATCILEAQIPTKQELFFWHVFYENFAQLSTNSIISHNKIHIESAWSLFHSRTRRQVKCQILEHYDIYRYVFFSVTGTSGSSRRLSFLLDHDGNYPKISRVHYEQERRSFTVREWVKHFIL